MGIRFLTCQRTGAHVAALICQLVVLGVLGVVSPCVGVQLVYEPFRIGEGPGEYSLGPLHGQPDPPIGPLGLSTFFAGNWVDDAEQPSQVVQETSIVPAWTLGGSVTAVGDGGRAARFLAEPWDDTMTGTYYLSFLVNFGASAHPSDGVGYRSVEFWPAGAAIGHAVQSMQVGYNQFSGCPGQICLPEDDWSTRMQLRVGGPTNFAQLLTDYSFNDDGETHFMIVKFELSEQTASDTISVYLDPTIGYGIPDGFGSGGFEEPEIATAVASGVDFTLGAIGAISRFGGTGVLPVFDELRVGTEFADVVPIPDPLSPCSEADYACYLEIISRMGLSGADVGFGDVNGDGEVTIADFRYWKDRRTDLTPGAGALNSLAVPEPANGTIVVAMAAAGTIAWRTRIFRIECLGV